jgi:hypothetical protein
MLFYFNHLSAHTLLQSNLYQQCKWKMYTLTGLVNFYLLLIYCKMIGFLCLLCTLSLECLHYFFV